MPKPLFLQLGVAAVVILTITGAGYAGFMVWQIGWESKIEDREPTVENKPIDAKSAPFLVDISEDTSEWVTYRNEAYNFEIRFPPELENYVVDQGSSTEYFGGFTVELPSSDPYQYTEFFDLGGSRFDNYGVPAECPPSGDSIGNIGGVEFTKVEHNYLNEEYSATYNGGLIYFQYRGKHEDSCYRFGYSRWGRKNEVSVAEISNRLDLLQQIVATFTLLNQ